MMYLLALALTLAVEAPIVWAGYRRLGVFAAANAMTHGALWLLRPQTTSAVMFSELAIVLAEAAIYARFLGGGWRRALVVSSIANALSLVAGVALLR